MHELDADAAAVVLTGLFGGFTVKVQFGHGFWPKVLFQGIEFGLQMTPTAKGVKDLIAVRNQQVAGVVFQGKIFSDHGRVSAAYYNYRVGRKSSNGLWPLRYSGGSIQRPSLLKAHCGPAKAVP
jgi:hypothetical protein